MSWFLPSKSSASKRKKTQRGKSVKSKYEWNPHRTLLGARILLGAALVIAGVVGYRWSESALLDYAARTRSVPMSASQIELVDAPSWMGPGIREQVQLTAASRITPNPMDSQSLRVAALALAQDPWVRQVRQVQRWGNGRMTVQADYRQPIALIATGDGYRLADAQGVVLPGLYLEHQADLLGLPIITGVRERTPVAGQAWQSQDVAAGLALVQTLADEPYADQIQRYDVSQRDARGRVRLVLHTDTGMVRWGLPPGMEQAIEPAAQVKRSWLRHVARTRGTIDAGGKVVEVYGARIAVYQPNFE